MLAFHWTMYNVKRIVGALNKPEIRSLVEKVVAEKDTRPIFDWILLATGYC